ncbi:MAG TPA: DUF2807 domain-containing protein [Bacteroidales bacterium]|nr:DUF2807 domain-containing protein [Bacteroidales bacterium]HPS15688.1 DUF2807 domain-containing protein [Bacteroidales bacterium]
MKTSNKILILITAVFVLSYFTNNLFMLYSVKAEITKPYVLSGNKIKFNKLIGESDCINLEGNLNVILKNDTINKLEIEADKNQVPLLEISNWAKKCYIYTNNANYRNSKENIINIILHLKRFDMICGADNVIFKTDSIINSEDFDLVLSGNSKADIKLNTKTFSCNLVSNSSCKISGKASDAHIYLMKNSLLSAKEFCIGDCNIYMMKNSIADLNVKGRISQTISSNSKLNIIGGTK